MFPVRVLDGFSITLSLSAVFKYLFETQKEKCRDLNPFPPWRLHSGGVCPPILIQFEVKHVDKK